LESRDIGFCVDSTNADTRFTRNRIRAGLLPKLEREYNPRLVEHLGHLAELAAESRLAQSREACRLLRRAELPRANPLCIFDAERLRVARRPLLRLFWRLV